MYEKHVIVVFAKILANGANGAVTTQFIQVQIQDLARLEGKDGVRFLARVRAESQKYRNVRRGPAGGSGEWTGVH